MKFFQDMMEFSTHPLSITKQGHNTQCNRVAAHLWQPKNRREDYKKPLLPVDSVY